MANDAAFVASIQELRDDLLCLKAATDVLRQS
jgi:hypothetical protein